ncbi:hypothetical protein [Brevundimonas diminuta]|uniref:hypothetical protein n=1 Tax=Brevundimonas diminuta TaxID=293 RepID=UPI003D9A4288
MTADLSALIARLEAAEAGSHELDKAVAVACGSTINVWAEIAADGTFLGSVRPVTTSLDAALALAERVHGEAYAIDLLQDLVDLNDTASLAIRDLPRLLCSFTLRAKLDGYAAEGEVNKNPKAQEG